MRYSDRERQKRYALARAFEGSGLTKADYCERHGLNPNSFDYWARMARQEQPGGMIEAAFFEVQVEDSPQASAARQPDLEVELPLGVKLRFFGTGVVR